MNKRKRGNKALIYGHSILTAENRREWFNVQFVNFAAIICIL